MHELLPQREAGRREVQDRSGGGERGSEPARGDLTGLVPRPIRKTGHHGSLFLSLAQGTTRLLLTKIPFFREVIVSSFDCEHCGWSNTEIQSAGRIQDQGVRYALTVTSLEVRATPGGVPQGVGVRGISKPPISLWVLLPVQVPWCL